MTPEQKNKRVAEILGCKDQWSSEHLQLGQLWHCGCPDDRHEVKKGGICYGLIDYCGNIEAAMGLFKWMREKRELRIYIEQFGDGYYVEFRRFNTGETVSRADQMNELSMGITNAFLRANGVEV